MLTIMENLEFVYKSLVVHVDYTFDIVFHSLIVKMPTCMAFGCSNTTGRSKVDGKSVLFTRIPSAPDSVRIEWLTRIHRADIDPKTFFPTNQNVLCSEHFTPECFEIDMRAKIMEGIEKRKFKDTTTITPTLFSHKQSAKTRQHTEKRLARKEKREVGFQF